MLLTPSFSFILNWLRFGAAWVVLWGHGQSLMGSQSPSVIGSYGHTMVLLFFVMSGYIIARTTKDGLLSLRTYLVYRLTRVYIVALPVVALCFLFYGFLKQFGLVDFLSFDGKFNALHFVKSLLFLNHNWSAGDYLLMNSPFWSLCFEFWYYIFFGFVFFAKSPLGYLLAAVVFIIMGPALWVLFPVWLMGVLLVYVKPVRFGGGLLLLLAIVSFAFALSFNAFGVDIFVQRKFSETFPQAWILGPATKFITDNLVGMFFFFSLWFLGSIGAVKINEFFIRLGSLLAGFSFSMYLLHDLIFKSFDAVLGVSRLSFIEYLGVSLLVLLLCFLFSLFTEAKTSKFRRVILDNLGKKAVI